MTRQIQTGNGEGWLAQWKMPGWFVSLELGFGMMEGPSILYTLANLKDTNRRNVRVLAEHDRPLKMPRRMNAATASRKARAILKQVAA